MERVIENVYLIGLIFLGVACFIGIFFQKIQGSSLFSWIFLTVIGLITGFASLNDNSDVYFLLIMIVTSFLISMSLVKQGHTYWGKFESFSFFLTFICLTVSSFGNAKFTIWVSTVAMFVIAVPYLFYLRGLLMISYITKTINILLLIATLFCTVVTFALGQNPIFISACALYWIIGVGLSMKKAIKIVH